MGLGLCYYELKDYDNAIKQFESILEKETDNFYDASYNKAICLYAKNDQKGCEGIFKKLNKKKKKPLTLLSQGIICLKDKKYELGKKKFEDVTSRDSDNIYGYHGRGQCLFENGNIEEALDSYNEALGKKPDYANALNSKAIALDKLNKKSEALKIYEDLNKLKPENAVYLLNYAVFLFENENLEKSEEILGKAEKLFETQKNDFDEEIVKMFEKNVNNLKEEINKKK